MKKIALGLVLLFVVALFIIVVIFPYYNAFLMDGIVKSIEYNSSAEKAECIMVNEKTGKIVEFNASGKRWKIVEVNNCIQVKMYPSIVPSKTGAYKMVDLRKIINCDAKNNDVDKKKQIEPQVEQLQKQKEGEAENALKEPVIESD